MAVGLFSFLGLRMCCKICTACKYVYDGNAADVNSSIVVKCLTHVGLEHRETFLPGVDECENSLFVLNYAQ